jgi:hypothetical protein
VITYQNHKIGEGLRISLNEKDGTSVSVDVRLVRIYDGIGRIGADFKLNKGREFRINSLGSLVDILDGEKCSFKMKLESGSFGEAIVRVRYKFPNLNYTFSLIQ